MQERQYLVVQVGAAMALAGQAVLLLPVMSIPAAAAAAALQ
jgi:hypothetical protein